MNIAFRRSTCTLFVLLVPAGCSQAAEPIGETGVNSEALSARPDLGAIFTETNAVEGNELVAYSRAADGTLTLVDQVPTGGAGTGSGLSAQGAIARDERWLFVVNAGSSDVSTFDLSTSPPSLVSRTSSGGTQPVSVTARGGLVYVLDAGGAGNIAGYRVDRAGELHAIAGSTLALSASSVTPTEIAFAPDGDTLVVTEKGTSLIDAYYIDVKGLAHGPTVNPSDGPAPFGFDFSPHGELVVSEAANSAASAYALHREVHLESISASVVDTQAAACWLVVSPNGRYAFAANAGSGTLSSFAIDPSGRLALESAVAGTIGAKTHPVDMAFGSSGKYLYSLASAGSITAFRVDDGTLTEIGSVGSLPASVTGLVAY